MPRREWLINPRINFGNTDIRWSIGSPIIWTSPRVSGAARMAPGDLADQLPASAPEHGESMDAILDDFRDLIVPALTHWNHPRFFAYFSISASGPGILAEMLSAALNVNGMLWKSSPAATELEQVTLGWLRQWLGLAGGLVRDHL